MLALKLFPDCGVSASLQFFGGETGKKKTQNKSYTVKGIHENDNDMT